MKNLSILAAALVVAFGVSACSSTTVGEKDRVRSQSIASIEAHKVGDSELSGDLMVMTGAEREAYHALADDYERNRYLLANGITVRREMNERLTVGMDREAAADALEGLFDSAGRVEDFADRLYFSAFNGESQTHMFCIFNRTMSDAGSFEFALKKWGSYTDKQMDRTREFALLEADLKRRLDRWLEAGMGEHEIRDTLRDVARLRAALISQSSNEIRDSSGDQGLEGMRSKDAASAGVGSDIWRLNAMLDFYDGLNKDPDYIVNQGEIDYWYHKVPVKGSKRFIVVEYRFVNRALASWFVYDKEFLGFSEHE